MSTQFTNRQWRLPNNENKDKQSNYSLQPPDINAKINISNPVNAGITNSISLWLKRTSPTSATQAYTINNAYGMWMNNTTLYITYGGTILTISTSLGSIGRDALNSTDWVHWVLIREATATSGSQSFKLYANTNLVYSTNSYNLGTNNTEVSQVIRKLNNTDSMDSFSIFNYALTDGTGGTVNQIAALYGSSSTGIGNPMSLSPKPVAYYPLGDQDAFNGADYLVPNSSLKDYVFDGIPGGTKLINSNINQSNTGGKFTVSFWQKPSSAGLIVFDHGGTGIGGFKEYSNRPIVHLASDYFQYFDAQTLVPGEWKHYVVFMDTSNITNSKLWINGTPIAQSTSHTTGSANSFTSGLRLNFGSYPEGSNMMYFINYEIDQTNVDVLYNNGSPITSTSGLSTAPDHWWKLNASDTYDSSTGNWTIEDHAGSNDGTSLGMTQANLVRSDLSFTSSYSPYALDFDGINDSVNIFSGSTPSTFQNIGNATSDYTISFWFKTTDSTVFTSSNTQWYSSDHIIELRGRYNSGNYNVPFNISAASNIGIGRGIGNYTSGGFVGRIASTTQGLNDNNWHHVAITVNNNGTPIIYIDNSVSTNTGLPSNWSSLTGVDTSVGSGTADLKIGARSTNAGSPVNYFDGSISNVSIWNAALTSAQVTALYNEGVPSNLNNHSAYSNLVSWWQLGSNTSWVDPYWIALDEKGTNNGQSQNVAAPNNMGENAIVDGVGSYANGLSNGMGGDEVVGDAPYSTANALSVNMDVEDRVTGISNATITTGGTGYATGTNIATTGGTGSGCTVDITASGAITAVTINNSGLGYSVGEVLTVVQSGGSSGTITVTSLNTPS